MAKGSSARLHRLTARQVQAAGEGKLDDGGGLQLRVSAGGEKWVIRYTAPSGRRREMGLGPAARNSTAAAGESVAAARRSAHEARELLRIGIDPLDARERQREAARQADEAKAAEKARERWTLGRCARDYHERVIEPTRSAKHGADWIASLQNHLPVELWQAPIASIDAPRLLSALLDVKPHERACRLSGDGRSIPETVQRVRQRLDAIFEDAVFHGRCSGNPAAAIRRKMREAGPRRERSKFRALPYKEAPALVQKLRQRDGAAARCLEFAILTAARTGEALGAQLAEFDLEAATWTVPPARMKARQSHAVFLPGRAVELLRAQVGLDDRWVLPSPMPKADGTARPLSNMAMLVVLDRLGVRGRTTVHGLCQATFSTWANEAGAGRPDVIEACLAHEESNRIRASYNRAQFADERRALLKTWAEFLARPAAPVVALSGRAA